MTTAPQHPDYRTTAPSPEEIDAARTPAGGYTRATLAGWGVPWPPRKGWRRRLELAWAEANRHVPSPSEVQAAATNGCGWSRVTLASWGVSWPPPAGWRERLAAEWIALQAPGNKRPEV